MELRTGLKVKAMLCKLSDIHRAVKKYFPDDRQEDGTQVVLFPGISAMPREDLGEKIAAATMLPVADDVLDCIQAMVQDTESNLREIAAMCGSDPAFAAMLLQAANSPIYGLPGRVESVDLAAVLLGKEGIGAMAARCQQNPSSGQAPSFGDRARRCSAAAGALARNTGKSDEAIAQTAGLLFEFGRIVIASVSPMRYGEVDSTLAGTALIEAERRRFSHSHADAGPALATYWRFPQSLIRAMQNYCHPTEAAEHAELAGIVGLAAVGAARGEELVGDDLLPLQDTLQSLRLAAEEAARLLRQVAASE
jgi:HD-like signal output (HDOD) protein